MRLTEYAIPVIPVRLPRNEVCWGQYRLRREGRILLLLTYPVSEKSYLKKR
jgi:hypothetical protein